MNTRKIKSRRKLIVIVLLAVAVLGAVIRHYAVPGSTTRNIGTLLMVLWVPVIGNVIAWLIGRVRRPAAAVAGPPDFAPGSAFTPHAWVEITLRPAAVPAEDRLVPEGEHRCALVLDTEGFSARWQVAAGQGFRRGLAQTLPVEFLSPAVALPRFAPGTAFRMLVGEAFIGDGKVLHGATEAS
ncbi:MAG: hypothetical protein EOO24_22850 [Comamonadaceae bacterium]|nr:MAG: hypothetical protein EOO24_22850 [Comamonadaceae bacterium]